MGVVVKKCNTCIYGNKSEYEKPCIVYRDDCPLYQKVGDGMTNKEAIANLEMISVAFVEPVTKEQRKLIDDTFDMAIKALEQEQSGETVSLEAFKQVMWERDIAIKQLNELGYELGQKIEPCNDAISRQAVLDITWEEPSYTDALNVLTEVRDKVKSLPSVNPQEPICPSAGIDCEDCPAYEPCGDAISRQAVLNEFYDMENLYERIKQLPSVNLQEPQTGHWIEKDGFDGDTYYDCSECGESWTTIEGTPWDNEWNYCPNCGAKMIEPQESEDKE